MNKYDNHIYLIICEVSLRLYSQTNYSTYRAYCNGMAKSLRDQKVSKTEERHISKIADELDKIFIMNMNDTGKYIVEFFLSEKYKNFEKVVMLMDEISPLNKINI